MAYSDDFNAWLKKLHCPESYATDHIKNTLHKGLLGLLWEDIPRIIRPTSEVSEVRKNILLYKLKHEPKCSLISTAKNIIQIREERQKLDTKIKSLQEIWNKQEYSCRQKANLLNRKKDERKTLQLKTEILKIKSEQMQMQIENCKKMQEICEHLMPPTVEEISQSIIIDCLSLLSDYSGGPEKRKVWNQISESLSSVKVPVLWNALLTVRSYCTDFLIKLDIEENQVAINKSKANIDIGIAKICSEHIDNVAKQFVHNGKTRTNEVATMEYVEKIEKIIGQQRPDLNDWLPLTLEVKKLEILQTEIQKELEKLENQLLVDNINIDDALMQLITEIKLIDIKTADCVQEVQNAFCLLKSSGFLIKKTKESLLHEIEKFQLLQCNEENQWLAIDLNIELSSFYNMDINALRKLMLKGETGAYRHLQTFFNSTSTTVDIPNGTKNMSNFPMLRVPIYYLVDFYKVFLVNVSLNKRINDEMMDVNNDSSESLMNTPTIILNCHDGIFKLLKITDAVCNRILQHSEEFDQILKTWSKQTVREVVSQIFHNSAYGATLDEWEKRFSMIIYVLQKSNLNVV